MKLNPVKFVSLRVRPGQALEGRFSWVHDVILDRVEAWSVPGAGWKLELLMEAGARGAFPPVPAGVEMVEHRTGSDRLKTEIFPGKKIPANRMVRWRLAGCGTPLPERFEIILHVSPVMNSKATK